MMPPISIFISAGEASGEHYGALLIAALRQGLGPKGVSMECFGMGGPRMVAAGLEPVVRAEDMAVMGVTEVVRHLPRIYAGYRRLRQSIRDRRPAAAVLIDFPDVHLKLAEELDRLGIPVIYFVSPQLWAWKKHRIERVRKFVRRMLVIFPFEQDYYRARGIEAEFVGHPLAELPPPAISRDEFARANRLGPSRAWIALLPGSRRKEIRANLPAMLEAAALLVHDFGLKSGPESEPEFVLPLASTLTAAQRSEVAEMVDRFRDKLTICLVGDTGADRAGRPASGARTALFHARASVVASGTATVEAALAGNPFVVVYRVSPITYAVAKRFVDVPHVAMANLIAGKRVVPELIQHDFTAANIVQHLKRLLPDGPDRQSMMQELAEVRRLLTDRARAGAEDKSGRGLTGGGIELSVMDRVAAVVVKEMKFAPGKAEPIQDLSS